MKGYQIYIFSAFLALSACSHKHQEAHEADEHAHKHAPGVIALDPHEAERFGVCLDTLKAQDFSTVVRTAGRVERAGANDAVVSAPTPGILHYSKGIEAGRGVGKGTVVALIDGKATVEGDRNAAAAARLETARLELERIEDLYSERLATQAELIAAQTELAAAKASYSPGAASGSAKAPVAGTVTALVAKEGQYVNAGDIIATIGSDAGSVLRAELPARYFAEASAFTDMVADIPGIGKVRISETGGRRNSGKPTSATASAYIPVYFSTPASVAPAGTPFTAYLTGSARSGVISVPAEALSEQQGHYYVYVYEGGEHYRKVSVETGDSDGLRTEIKKGLKEGDVVAVSGVTALRLAETSAVAPQGHSHNH